MHDIVYNKAYLVTSMVFLAMAQFRGDNLRHLDLEGMFSLIKEECMQYLIVASFLHDKLRLVVY